MIIAGVCLLFLIPLVTTSESKGKKDVNNETDGKLVSSDTSKKQLLVTEKRNQMSDISSTESKLPRACSSLSRPSSSSFILAFPSLALSRNFLHEVGMNESENDQYISAVLKRVDLEIDRYEEIYPFKNRSEEQSNKVMSEEDTSGVCQGSLSSSESSISSDTASLCHRDSIVDHGNSQNKQNVSQPNLLPNSTESSNLVNGPRQNVGHYQRRSLTNSSAQGNGHSPYPTSSSDRVNYLVQDSYFTESEEDRSVVSDTELSFSWDCFSELLETKFEHRDDLKPASDGYSSSDETGHLFDPPTGNCSFQSLKSIQTRRIVNNISAGCPKSSCCDQLWEFAETSV